MSELSDYRRLCSDPLEASLRKEISELKKQLQPVTKPCKPFSYRGRAAQPIQTSTFVTVNGPPAWWVGDDDDRVILSVNGVDLGFSDPAPGYVYIRDWGYGEGVADALVEQGVCELVCRVDINGHGSMLAIMRAL